MIRISATIYDSSSLEFIKKQTRCNLGALFPPLLLKTTKYKMSLAKLLK